MSKLLLSFVILAVFAVAFTQAENIPDDEPIVEVALSDEALEQPQVNLRLSCQVGGNGACTLHCRHMGRKFGYCRNGTCYCRR